MNPPQDPAPHCTGSPKNPATKPHPFCYFYLLSVTGPAMPHALERPDAEQACATKPEAIAWLRQSLSLIGSTHAHLSPTALQHKVKIEGETTTADGMYLRLICHDNEHLGQLIAYARTLGIVPPWSAGAILPK